MSYQELLDFMDRQGITSILSAVICGDCDAADCFLCLGHVIMSEVNNQLCREGLELMKTIAKEWAESQE